MDQADATDQNSINDTANAIVEFGAEAVRHYQEIARLRFENEVPEVFLGGFIASRLYSRFHCPVHIERLYSVIAADLGINLTKELLIELGGLRADVAMYRDKEEVPAAIIELKIFDEPQQPSSIGDDLRKIEKLVKQARKGQVHAFLGVMVCETSRVKLPVRTEALNSVVGRTFQHGGEQQSSDGNWKWWFACAQL